MQTLSELTAQQHANRPDRSENPAIDSMLTLLIELGEEVCVLRDKLDVTQQLLAHDKPADATAVNAWQPDQDELQSRLERHRVFFEELFKRLPTG